MRARRRHHQELAAQAIHLNPEGNPRAGVVVEKRTARGHVLGREAIRQVAAVALVPALAPPVGAQAHERLGERLLLHGHARDGSLRRRHALVEHLLRVVEKSHDRPFVRSRAPQAPSAYRRALAFDCSTAPPREKRPDASSKRAEPRRPARGPVAQPNLHRALGPRRTTFAAARKKRPPRRSGRALETIRIAARTSKARVTPRQPRDRGGCSTRTP